MIFYRLMILFCLTLAAADYAAADEGPATLPGFIPLHPKSISAHPLPGAPLHFIALSPRKGGVPLARITRPQPSAATVVSVEQPVHKHVDIKHVNIMADATPPEPPPTQGMTREQANQIVSLFASAD